jgi:hypothetical protein
MSGAGLNDTTNGEPVFPRLLTPNTTLVGGGTDVCSYFAQQNLNDYSAAYTGRYYRDNTPAGSGAQKCTIATFWQPSLATTGSPVLTMGIRTELSGNPYLLPGTLNVPSLADLYCAFQGGSTSSSGCVIEPDTVTPNFVWSSYSYQNPQPLVNAGQQQGSTGYQATLNAVVDGESINCLNHPNVVGYRNSYGQQGTILRNVAIFSCPIGVMIDGQGTAGGTQNRGELANVQISLPATSTNIVMSKLTVVSGGSGYTTATATISGCGTVPAYTLTVVGGVVTAATPSPSSSSPFGVCNSPSSVTATVTGAGTGAVIVPAFEMLAPSEGVYLASTAGGGMQREMSVVGGAASINPPYGYQDEAGAQIYLRDYAESTQNGIALDMQQTAGIAGDSIHGITGESANEEMVNLLENGAAGPVSFEAGGLQGSAENVIQDNGVGGATVPCTAEGYSTGGNGCSLSVYDRDDSSQVLTNLQNLASTIATGVLAYNCGSCSSSNYPRPGYPVKNAGGYAQSMSTGDASPIWGVVTSQGLPNQSNTKEVVVATGGSPVPLYWDNAPVPGDVWVASPTDSQPARAHDAGVFSAWLTSNSGWIGGYVAKDGSCGSTSTLSTPSISGVGSSVSGAGSVSVNYQFAAATYCDFGYSAASSTFNVSNAPNGIAGNKITLTSLPVPSTSQMAVFRTGLTEVDPTVAAHCNSTTGTFDYLILTGSQSAIWFAPTVNFTGGGGTNPSAKLWVAGGQIVGWTFTNYGASCTGNATGTLTDSSCQNGFIGYSNGSSTFVDSGRCGEVMPGQTSSTPPASAQIGTRATVAPQYFTGTTAGVSSIVATSPVQATGPTGAVTVSCPTCTANNAPLWLEYEGTGADGAESVTSGSVGLTGVKYYTTFNVSSGATVTVSSYLTVHATGACTINGNILANGATNTLNNFGVGGGSSGGSGGGSSAGTAGKASFAGWSYYSNGPTVASAGGAGASSGGSGTAGAVPSANLQRALAAQGPSLDGADISGAASVAGANSGGAAVEGGGGVTLICASISGTGVIDLAGAQGNPPSANSEGASSGAGGGVALLSSQATVSTWPTVYAGPGKGGQVSVPYAVPGGTSSAASGLPAGAQPPVLALSLTSGALSGCTVTAAGSGLGSSPALNWVIQGGGGTGGTITPTYSGGAVASCTASGGSGYTATSYTTAGAGGDGGSGWYAEFSGW